MESSAWTNERLDEFSRRIEDRFEQVDRRFDRVERGIQDLGASVDRGFQAINDRLFQIGGGIIVALIGVVGAVLLRGA